MTVWQSCTLQLLISFLLYSNCNTVYDRLTELHPTAINNFLLYSNCNTAHDRLLTEFHSTAIHHCFTLQQLYITRCITVLFRVLTRVALPPSLLVIFVLYGNCNTVHDRLVTELHSTTFFSFYFTATVTQYMTVWQSCTLHLLIIFLLYSNCNTVYNRLTELHSTTINCFSTLQQL